MPIRPELREFYGPHWRTVVRPRILSRAGNRCEQCNKPNGYQVETFTDRYWCRMWWRPAGIKYASWRNFEGDFTCVSPPAAIVRTVKVVLTVAHLNHVSGDDRDDNLKALCQWCHLNYDKVHHAETRAARKDATRPLLSLAS